ncbi:hypothetical protein D3C81_1189730 [compost metagenome]
MRVVLQRLQQRGLAVDFLDLRVQRQAAVDRFQVDELVDQEGGHQRAGQAIEHRAGLGILPAFHALAMPGPEVAGQLHDAGVEQVLVFQDLVVVVVFSRQPQCARLDAHVDVFGHQHHLALGVLLLQRADHAQDLVVGLALRQALGQLDLVQAGLEEQLALRVAVAERGQRQPVVEHAVGAGDQRVERAADHPRVAGDFAHALLVVVQLLERHHRQIDVVFLEAEQRARVVHQHVGVQHEQLAGPLCLAGAARGAGRRLDQAHGRRGRGGRGWRRGVGRAGARGAAGAAARGGRLEVARVTVRA